MVSFKTFSVALGIFATANAAVIAQTIVKRSFQSAYGVIEQNLHISRV
jgi:hypothetical protein